MPTKKKKTEFGRELAAFLNRHDLYAKDVAAAAGVSCSTLHDVTRGRSAGHELIPKVREFMARYDAEHQHQ